MSGWGELIAAFCVFLLSHSVPIRQPVKPMIVARIGRTGFTFLYSALSVVVLVWLIIAAGRAPYVELWPRLPWQKHVTLAAMAAVCLIVAMAAFRPNPFSFGGWRDERFNPSAPGIAGWLRHPYLAALTLWAAGHNVPNGDLAHALLFGGFALFALLGMRLIDRRRRREMGPETWLNLLQAAKAGRSLVPDASTIVRLLAALALLAALISLHPLIIGLEAVSW
ncbi:putative membrane protein [Hoeflea sp. IMCC20628]|uniref:NnrU family protein n=1 Tax=Hoeflea sp. IMCC20628 TaxID=1620421 RepID=UPI00063AD3BF|nr:NnrU family protein [Hoeflea sp. IMCC20628]AKI00685.1 putative membrane protein [Hoeflea sp. IMCC20628]